MVSIKSLVHAQGAFYVVVQHVWWNEIWINRLESQRKGRYLCVLDCFSVYCSSEAEQTKGGNHERLLQRNWNYLFDHAMQNDIWFVCNWNTVDWLKCLMFVTEGTGSARTAPYFGTRDSNSNMRIFRAMDEWPSISAIFGQAICTFVTYKSWHVSGPIFLMFFRSQDLEVDLAADLPEVGNCGWVKRQHSY